MHCRAVTRDDVGVPRSVVSSNHVSRALSDETASPRRQRDTDRIVDTYVRAPYRGEGKWEEVAASAKHRQVLPFFPHARARRCFAVGTNTPSTPKGAPASRRATATPSPQWRTTDHPHQRSRPLPRRLHDARMGGLRRETREAPSVRPRGAEVEEALRVGRGRVRDRRFRANPDPADAPRPRGSHQGGRVAGIGKSAELWDKDAWRAQYEIKTEDERQNVSARLAELGL